MTDETTTKQAIRSTLKNKDGTLLYPYNPDYINRTGDTMTGQLTCQTNQAWQFADVIKGTNPEVAKYLEAIILDSTGTDTSVIANRLAAISTALNTDGTTSTELQAYDSTEGSTASARLGIYYPKGGTPYTYAPTPANNDDSTKIATTAFVSNMLTSSNSNFITYKKAVPGYIKFANGIFIQWGSVQMTTSSKNVTLPIAGSGQYTYIPVTCDGINTTGPHTLGTNNTKNTYFTIWSAANTNPSWVQWYAIGY